MKYFLALVSSITILTAQTQIDLQHQSKRVDFSSAQYTKPFKTGTALPATCAAGEVFLLLSGLPGTNIYTCIANNIWVAQGGSSLPESEETGKLLTSAGENSFEWISLHGDVLGGASTKVVGLQGRPVSNLEPADGDVMVWSAAEGQWKSGKGVEPIAVQINGVSRGSRTVHNYVAGTGILQTASDTGDAIQMQQAIDTAVVQTRANAQSGADLLISLSSNSGTAFAGTMSPTLGSYANGMVAQFRPNEMCSGTPTLDIDALGATPLYEADGTTAMMCTSGEQFSIWYDATANGGAGGWRKQAGGSPAPPSSGMVKSGGAALETAIPGTDYVAPTTGSSIQKADGNGGLTAAIEGTDYLAPTTGSSIQKADGNGGLTAAIEGTDYPAVPTMTSVFTHPINTIGSGFAIAGSANGGTFHRIHVPGYINVTKVIVGLHTRGSNGCTFAVGIYSTALTKLAQTAGTDCATATTTTGPKSVNLTSSITLAPGEYYVVYGTNDMGMLLTSVGGNAAYEGVVNASTLKVYGRVAAIYSSGELVDSLPALTGSSVSLPIAVLHN